MEALFLGTSSMVPTKERNHAGIFVTYRDQGILLDCGEGTQRQLKSAGISLTKITKILLTHWHGDHVLGLPGLVQTMGSMDYPGTLHIYGPRGTRKRFGLLKKALVFEDRFETEVHDIAKRVFFEDREYFMEALPLDHSTPCLGYSIVERDRRRIKVEALKSLGIPEGPLVGQLAEGHSIKWKGKTVNPEQVSYLQKGKKLCYVTDTAVCNNAVELAMEADAFICEATYDDDLEEKAGKYKHLTARQAASIANQAGVKRLILTHFSQRYKETGRIVESARTVFSNSTGADDFMRFKV